MILDTGTLRDFGDDHRFDTFMPQAGRCHVENMMRRLARYRTEHV